LQHHAQVTPEDSAVSLHIGQSLDHLAVSWPVPNTRLVGCQERSRRFSDPRIRLGVEMLQQTYHELVAALRWCPYQGSAHEPTFERIEEVVTHLRWHILLFRFVEPD